MQHKTEYHIKAEVERSVQKALNSFIGEPVTPRNLEAIELKIKEIIDIFLKHQMDSGTFFVDYLPINLKVDKKDPSLIHISIGKINKEDNE